MSDHPYIIDVSVDNFANVVLEGSRQVPVLVDFWASWCGPCKTLLPLLTRLAEEFAGKFILAKVNIDEQQELAARFAVRSVPTVKVFRHGAEVEQFMGAQPEGALREVLARHIERESDKLRAEADRAVRGGELDRALALLEQARNLEPDDHRVVIDLAGVIALRGDTEAALSLLGSLPADKALAPEVETLRARIEFSGLVRESPDPEALEQALAVNPGDSEARYRLAAHRILRQEYDLALEELLTLLRKDRGYRDDAARKAILAVFGMLGNQGPLVQRYRSKLAMYLL